MRLLLLHCQSSNGTAIRIRCVFRSTRHGRKKQKVELALEYVLSSPDDSGTQITLGPETFSLGFRGWFAVLQPPDHALSPFPTQRIKRWSRFACLRTSWC